MKTKSLIILFTIAIVSCTNTERENRYKAISQQDSILLQQARLKDSTISSYIKSVNTIQDNLDSIKHREKMLSLRSKEGVNSPTDRVIQDIKAIDALMIKNNRAVASLQGQLRRLGKRDAELEKMVTHLNQELAERDSNITALQATISKTNASMKQLTQQYTDSMSAAREANGSLKTTLNTVYYTIGTMKELKDRGIIDKQGGIIGIGATAKLKQNFNSNYFTKADKTTLDLIPLRAHFSKIVTDHPNSAFTVKNGSKSDSLIITNSDSFWSESKYLVVVIK